MGLLEQFKKLEYKIPDPERQASKYTVAYISDNNGTLHITKPYDLETKEDWKALCEWYLKIYPEL